jgi:hypothetical protein
MPLLNCLCHELTLPLPTLLPPMDLAKLGQVVGNQNFSVPPMRRNDYGPQKQAFMNGLRECRNTRIAPHVLCEEIVYGSSE